MNCKTHVKHFGFVRILKHPRNETRLTRQCKKCHATVNSIECEFCRQKGIKLMRGIHDAVSIHIGKKPVYPNDLKFTHNYVTRAVQNAR